MKRKLKDHSGRRFGKLVALSMSAIDISPANNHEWLFGCDCGGVKVARIKNVTSGKTRSCGCIAKNLLVNRNLRHGMAHTHEYKVWKWIRRRCSAEASKDYVDYGARGIAVCARWKDFSNFYHDMGICPDGMSIDRIDNNGNYEPSNCRWAMPAEQANNKRNNRLISHNGEQKTLLEWCKIYGIDHSKARYRLSKNWPFDKVFSSKDFRK